MNNDLKIIVIVGETASGKSALAHNIAKKINGEIIAADSRTIYRGVPIGTASPSVEMMREVPYHLVGFKNLDEEFNVALYKSAIEWSVKNIQMRGNIPILVGGSGLIIDAYLYDYSFASEPNFAERERINSLTDKEMQTEIQLKGLKMPTNFKNKRHLSRIIENNGMVGTRKDIRKGTFVFGLSIDRDLLRSNITARIDNMVQNGLIDEAQLVSEKYGWGVRGLSAPAYKSIRPYLEGRITLNEFKYDFLKRDLNLAKRQRTWFKRNKSIHWIKNQIEIVDIVTTYLNK